MFESAEKVLKLACWISKITHYTGVIINNHIQNRIEIRRQVEALSPYFDFIGLDELIARMHQNKGKPFCLLTFDDGKYINYEETAPELERLGVPAAFYLATGAIGTNNVLWFDVLKKTRETQVNLPKELQSQTLKKYPLAKIKSQLEKICSQNAWLASPNDSRMTYMSWDNILSLHSWEPG